MIYRLTGPFAAFDAGNGAWRLSAGAASGMSSGAEILLCGTSGDATQLFAAAPRIESVVLEWSRDIVIVTLLLAGASGVLTARSALVHEPQEQLYRCLPLAEFDAGARGFWKRVFCLLGIPGGRFLLRLMTRRGRKAR